MTRKRTTKPKPLSLRAYAKRKGVSPEAVSKAITSGRLKESVVRVRDQPKIADPELADREWEANTQPRVDHQRAPVPPADGPVGDVPDYFDSRAKREAAAARREFALADLAEIEVAERREELVPVEDVESRLVAVFSQCRNKLLGVPSRARQQDPGLTMPQIALFESLIREALEDLTVEGGDA